MKLKLFVLAAIAMIAATAPAITWANYGTTAPYAGLPGWGNHRWDTASNWSPGAVPLATDVVDIYYGNEQTDSPAGWGYCLIDSATTAVAKDLYITRSGTVTQGGYLKMTGGSLTVDQFQIGGMAGMDVAARVEISGGTVVMAYGISTGRFLNLGQGSATAKGYLSMSGNATFSGASRMNLGNAGYGEMVMADNAYFTNTSNDGFNIGNQVTGVGKLTMTGGKIETFGTGGLKVGNAGKGEAQIGGTGYFYAEDLFINATNSLLNITGGGKVFIDYKGADWDGFVTKVLGYQTTGILTGNGSSANVNFAWDNNNTTVLITAIPEPVTLAILGLGSLALLRRRK